jgi:Ring hydroxylating alpha subunit (catalytic domain)
LLETEATKKLGDESRRWLDLTARAGINLVIYPNLLVYGNGVFAVYEPLAVDLTNVRWFTALMENVPEEVNLLRLRFAEDFTNVAAGDDNEAFEQMQTVLTNIPEMEWLDMSRGLGTEREVDEGGGVIRGNIMDETAIRRSYDRWNELMNLDFPPSLG